MEHARASYFPLDGEIGEILAKRVEAIAGDEDGFGIVVGLVEPQAQRLISYGHLAQGNLIPVDGSTIFEIASVTKVFTALLLADMANKGEVSLTEPVKEYLPANVRLPERNGRSITLQDLATHTSGLPFMPHGGEIESAAGLYQYLAGYALRRDPGTEWDYSNLGYWLISEALASRAGMPFEDLLGRRILAPLKLVNTGFTLPPGTKSNFAPGHDAALQPAPATSAMPGYALMPAAGGLYSTVNDLMTFPKMAMGYEHTPLDSALAECLRLRAPIEDSGNDQAFGWTVIGKGGDPLIFRDGGSFGYASCVAWDRTQRVGLAVLSNQAASVADIALHLLRPDIPLEHPAVTRHKEISLSASMLDDFIGEYESPDEGVFNITRGGDFLDFEAPAEWGLPKLRIRPESPTDFFVLELPLRVVFERDSSGQVNGILVYPPRGQSAVPATKKITR